VDNPAAIDPRLLLLVRPTFDNYNVQQPTLCWENRNTVLVSMGSAVKPIVSHQTCWPRPPTYPVQASSFASSTNSHRQPLSRCMYDEDTQYIDPEVADSIEKDTERPVSYSVPSSPASSGEWLGECAPFVSSLFHGQSQLASSLPPKRYNLSQRRDSINRYKVKRVRRLLRTRQNTFRRKTNPFSGLRHAIVSM